MSNIAEVLIGIGILAWLLFLRRPGASKVLSASRWMLLAWGFLILIHWASPIQYFSMQLSVSTRLYCLLWLGTFVVADNASIGSSAEHNVRRSKSFECSTKGSRILTLLAVGGMLVLGGIISRGINIDLESVISELRQAQLEGANAGVTKTIATVLACGGLVVALVETSAAGLKGTPIPKRVCFALLAYLSVTVLTGGRPGMVLAPLALFVAAVASIYLGGHGFARHRPTLLAAGVLFALALGYIMVVVSTRSSGWTGGMDNKVVVMNTLWDADLLPEFRDSLRPLGVFGDTITEAFYYFSPPLYGLDHSLMHYHGPFGLGSAQFAYVARRFEGLFGIKILEPMGLADDAIFERIGVFPHFLRTAVQDTFSDFGLVLGLPFVFLCGVLSRRSRVRALETHSPYAIGVQALVCSGAAWTILSSPFGEQSWAFPWIWFLLLPALAKAGNVLRLLSSPAAVSTSQRRRVRKVATFE